MNDLLKFIAKDLIYSNTLFSDMKTLQYKHYVVKHIYKLRNLTTDIWYIDHQTSPLQQLKSIVKAVLDTESIQKRISDVGHSDDVNHYDELKQFEGTLDVGNKRSQLRDAIGVCLIVALVEHLNELPVDTTYLVEVITELRGTVEVTAKNLEEAQDLAYKLARDISIDAYSDTDDSVDLTRIPEDVRKPDVSEISLDIITIKEQFSGDSVEQHSTPTVRAMLLEGDGDGDVEENTFSGEIYLYEFPKDIFNTLGVELERWSLDAVLRIGNSDVFYAVESGDFLYYVAKDRMSYFLMSTWGVEPKDIDKAFRKEGTECESKHSPKETIMGIAVIGEGLQGAMEITIPELFELLPLDDIDQYTGEGEYNAVMRNTNTGASYYIWDDSNFKYTERNLLRGVGLLTHNLTNRYGKSVFEDLSLIDNAMMLMQVMDPAETMSGVDAKTCEIIGIIDTDDDPDFLVFRLIEGDFHKDNPRLDCIVKEASGRYLFSHYYLFVDYFMCSDCDAEKPLTERFTTEFDGRNTDAELDSPNYPHKTLCKGCASKYKRKEGYDEVVCLCCGNAYVEGTSSYVLITVDNLVCSECAESIRRIKAKGIRNSNSCSKCEISRDTQGSLNDRRHYLAISLSGHCLDCHFSPQLLNMSLMEWDKLPKGIQAQMFTQVDYWLDQYEGEEDQSVHVLGIKESVNWLWEHRTLEWRRVHALEHPQTLQISLGLNGMMEMIHALAHENSELEPQLHLELISNLWGAVTTCIGGDADRIDGTTGEATISLYESVLPEGKLGYFAKSIEDSDLKLRR